MSAAVNAQEKFSWKPYEKKTQLLNEMTAVTFTCHLHSLSQSYCHSDTTK